MPTGVEQFVGGQIAGERRVPDLQAGLDGVSGGDLLPVLVAAGDEHRARPIVAHLAEET